MPVINANTSSVILLARSVDAARRYIDLYEIRAPEIQFALYDPTGEGTILAYLTEAEAMERLAAWPTRVPGWWEQARLPVSYRTHEGEAWLGWPDGAIP